MRDLSGRTAAVTGAASGIGRSLARRLAAEGCEVAASDIDEEGLEETARLVRGAGGRISTAVVDVADRDAVEGWTGQAIEEHDAVDLVINNAGMAVVDSIENVDYEDFHRVVDVLFWGVVHGARAFLPHLRTRPEAHLANVGSVHSFLSGPYNGPYCAAKAAVRGLTETLAEELRGSDVGVSGIYPGGIDTNIARNAKAETGVDPDEFARRFSRMTLTSPDRAARIIIDGIRAGKRRIRVGPDAVGLDWVTRLAPDLAHRLVGFGYRRAVEG